MPQNVHISVSQLYAIWVSIHGHTRLCVQQFVQVKTNIHCIILAPHHWSFVNEIYRRFSSSKASNAKIVYVSGRHHTHQLSSTLWRHQMETFSALLVLCAGNSPVTGEFPAQRPVTRSFDIFFDLCLNKRFSKLSWGWGFEMPSCSLWCHCNALVIDDKQIRHFAICVSLFGFI